MGGPTYASWKEAGARSRVSLWACRSNVPSVSRALKGEELITSMLQPGESIVASIFATQCDPPTSKSGKVAGCLAITNQRVMFAGRAVTKTINRTIPLTQVSSLGFSKGMMLSHVQLTLAGSYENFLVKYKEAEEFMVVAQAELQKSRNPQSSPTEATVVSTADELKKLAELHQQGILTAEEFAEAKSRVLNG